MPLYMDVHRNLGNVTPDDLADAHRKDVETQQKYGVSYHKYWLNQETGTVFCLVEGPNREACDAVHRTAHGLVADELIEVQPTLVEAFMGAEQPNGNGAAVGADGGLDVGSRVVLFTEVANFAEAAHRLGDEVGLRIVREHDEVVRGALQRHHGREVQHTGEGIMASFASASAALRAASEIQQHCATECREISGFRPHVRIGLAAGEPVEGPNSLFGASITVARKICSKAEPGEVLMSEGVRELAVGKGFNFDQRGSVQLKGIDHPVSLFGLRSEPIPVTIPAAAQAAAPSWTLSTRRFFRELKRRHVLTVGAVYAGVLFILLQAAELTFEPLGLPSWAYTLVLVLGIFGFPLAIVLAWGFDVTESGVERTPRLSDD